MSRQDVEALMGLVDDYASKVAGSVSMSSCGAYAESRKCEAEGRRIRAELRTALAEALGGWMDMDSAPRDGTPILVTTAHGEIELTNYFICKTDDYVPADGGLFAKVSRVYAEGWNGNTPIAWMPAPVPFTQPPEAAP